MGSDQNTNCNERSPQLVYSLANQFQTYKLPHLVRCLFRFQYISHQTYWPVGHPEIPPINFEPLTPIDLDNNPIAYLMLFRNCIFWAKYIKFDSLQCLEEILAVRYHIWTVVSIFPHLVSSLFGSPHPMLAQIRGRLERRKSSLLTNWDFCSQLVQKWSFS